ncbi:patatin-like phospholipase family protein [Paenibacillus abyssi]|uniref:Phospholipase n=1 Tax=Paenibacillus abyssi TaxID=1340531 RepID=A0A917CG83_9BACL|nr:patatin-like phospholipase family protein [Paenibacillus abyssi]GGF86935.1 phospholipase [Paenibacillus abyssi]
MKINAVFEGGGVKGISLVGAVFAAEQCGVTFGQVAGTSSGAIVAALLAAGYSAEEMTIIIRRTPFAAFLKRSQVFNVKYIGPAARLLLRKGLYSGDEMELWMRKLLSAKGISTFADLPPNKLRIIASDISNGKLLVLPDDIAQYGMNPKRLEVAKAIRMSASLPYFFDPVVIKEKQFKTRISGIRLYHKTAYIVDGGLLSNFPLWLFDREQRDQAKPIPVVGFQMVGKNENRPRTIRGPLSMLTAIFETMLQAHDERYIEKENRDRTIKIPTLGIRTTQFNLSLEASEQLFESGRLAAEKYFCER